ncbi:pyridoxamine 5'-phosphate oxidase family protein [Candidatus Bathyarchaeota archaeon]|nr:pyridoxamine 5'-phosphate oxidase family protein [Candidatus Bathyarchaeota archaeon]
MPSIVDESLGYLGQQTVSYVATCDEGQPHVRAMMLLYIDGAFYYATGTRDAKLEQLTRNSRVEVCVPIGEGDDGGSLRLTGSMEFVTDTEVRRRVYECVGFTQSFWDDP